MGSAATIKFKYECCDEILLTIRKEMLIIIPFITAQKCLKRDTMDQLTSFTILWNHVEVKLLETFSSLEKEAVS